MVELPVKAAKTLPNIQTDFRQDGRSLVVAPGGGSHTDPSRGQRQIRLVAVLAEHKIAHAIELLGSALSQYNKDQ